VYSKQEKGKSLDATEFKLPPAIGRSVPVGFEKVAANGGNVMTELVGSALSMRRVRLRTLSGCPRPNSTASSRRAQDVGSRVGYEVAEITESVP
jgi:hypothetical protein